MTSRFGYIFSGGFRKMTRALLEGMSFGSRTMLSLSLSLFGGFSVTRVTKRMRLPDVSGYIIAGILMGPYFLDLIPSAFIAGTDFISDIALSFIAFRVGQFFLADTLKSSGKSMVIVTLWESVLAAALVALMMKFFFKASTPLALITGAIASATAPASTMMTIRQYDAKGPFVDLLLQVIALDDVVALLLLSLASAAAQGMENGSASMSGFIAPVLLNIAAVAAGFGLGWGYCIIMKNRSRDNRLILTVALLLAVTGVCSMLDISPLLCCMALGAAIINKSGDSGLFAQVDGFSPPILACFFIFSGMRMDISALKTVGIMGVSYFIMRIVGKYLGAYAGCALAHTDTKTRRYFGMALVPQAGVSIGLAFLGMRILPPQVGSDLCTIILTSSVLYELIGPACAKGALMLSGVINKS